MRGTSLFSMALVSSMLLSASWRNSTAADPKVKIGDRVANLTFKDIHYQPRSLSDFPKAKVFVLVFTNSACPVSQRYLPVLRDMEKQLRSKNVQFLAVNESAEDSIVAMASQAVQHEMEFPFVKDFDQSCAAAVGADRTPAVVVLDAEHRLRYRGRIDDQYRLGGTRAAPTRRDLAEAIDAVLAGKEVAVTETPIDGCPITKVAAAPAAARVNYADHIAPILNKHCVECHRPGTTAPFSLVSFRDAKAHAEAIAEVVAEGRMPPWFACEEFGKFSNRRGLNGEEKDQIAAWARSGMEMGDVAKLPAPPPAEPADGWLIGKPDLIVSAPAHDIQAQGLIAYKYVILPHVFKEDVWMQGIQILPSNPRVVHHCNMAYMSGNTGRQSNFITGTVPGGSPMRLDNGVAFRIPKGSSIVLQIHYVTTGKEEKCQISVGFKYASGTVQQQLKHELLVDHRFAIPPGAPAHPVSAAKVLDCDAVGVGLFVHMHLRGRDMTFHATRPDGKSETLLMVPNFSFDWQIPYVWKPGAMVFPKGTRLDCLAHYDNSEFNAHNPDPKATVKDGQQSHEEMLNGFVFYVDANEKLNLNIDSTTGRPVVKK
jgi:peroxiredoxin